MDNVFNPSVSNLLFLRVFHGCFSSRYLFMYLTNDIVLSIKLLIFNFSIYCGADFERDLIFSIISRSKSFFLDINGTSLLQNFIIKIDTLLITLPKSLAKSLLYLFLKRSKENEES